MQKKKKNVRDQRERNELSMGKKMAAVEAALLGSFIGTTTTWNWTLFSIPCFIFQLHVFQSITFSHFHIILSNILRKHHLKHNSVDIFPMINFLNFLWPQHLHSPLSAHKAADFLCTFYTLCTHISSWINFVKKHECFLALQHCTKGP